MSIISVIMPCYNAEKFLAKSVQSVIDQTFKDWELIIVDDGSTDNSRQIALHYQQLDKRIKVETKENGGYVSARLHGLKFISDNSLFLLFYDADDILHSEMLRKGYEKIKENNSVGAVYCNHKLIDESDNELDAPGYGIRIVPTALWMKIVDEDIEFTPFISIFCWTTRMIEPMTIIRREAYDRSSGWDERFGKGKGNIGDGVLLFSEIALTWKVIYINEPLYYYRKHPEQMTASSTLNQAAGDKVLAIWDEKIKTKPIFYKDIKAAILCYKYRLYAFTKVKAIKHLLRYKPIHAIGLILSIGYKYILSFQLIFYRRTKVFQFHR